MDPNNAPPGAVAPVARVYTPAEFRHFLSINPLRASIFQNLSYHEAMQLTSTYRLRLRKSDYFMVHDATCEDDRVDYNDGPLAPFVLNAPLFDASATTLPPYLRCTTRAVWTPAGPPRAELSTCNEPHDLPNPGTHAHADPRNPLCCRVCKSGTAWHMRWLQRQLWFGACANCQTWSQTLAHSIANFYRRPTHEQCHCPPAGEYRNRVNGNERKISHLCRLHAMGYWNVTRAPAQAEIDYRRRMKLRKKRKLSPYRKSGRTPRPQLTPDQRRSQMVQTNARQAMYNEPRCYCGNVLTAADHARPAYFTTGVRELRNCVGGRRWVRAES